MIRKWFVLLHRWFGLGMALFLVVEGFTGCLLAFNAEVTRILNPKLFVSKPTADAKPLDLASLAEKAEAVDPSVRVAYFARYRDDQVMLRCYGRKDPKTGVERDIGFMYLVSIPTAGRSWGGFSGAGTTLEGAFSLT